MDSGLEHLCDVAGGFIPLFNIAAIICRYRDLIGILFDLVNNFIDHFHKNCTLTIRKQILGDQFIGYFNRIYVSYVEFKCNRFKFIFHVTVYDAALVDAGYTKFGNPFVAAPV